MPLFGRKKKPTSKGATGGYPRQSTTPYPTQQKAYTSHPPQYGAQPQVGYPTAQSQSPPAYTPKGQQQPPPVPMQPLMPVQGAFDQGARFDANRPPTIPPPPPGVAPTAAQIAVSQGQNVVMTQQKRDIWGLGSDGGYNII